MPCWDSLGKWAPLLVALHSFGYGALGRRAAGHSDSDVQVPGFAGRHYPPRVPAPKHVGARVQSGLPALSLVPISGAMLRIAFSKSMNDASEQNAEAEATAVRPTAANMSAPPAETSYPMSSRSSGRATEVSNDAFAIVVRVSAPSTKDKGVHPFGFCKGHLIQDRVKFGMVGLGKRHHRFCKCVPELGRLDYQAHLAPQSIPSVPPCRIWRTLGTSHVRTHEGARFAHFPK